MAKVRVVRYGWSPNTRVVMKEQPLLSARRLTHFERIRDGGSLAADFDGDDGGRYILFFRLRTERGPGPDEMTYLGFEDPVVIDRDPARRPADTDTIIYSDFAGPTTAVTWAQALELLSALTRSPDLEPSQVEGVRRMQRLAEDEGRQPPQIAKVLRFR
jgi:hypothetical protein